jgi:uncharacterized membrane protein YhhN
VTAAPALACAAAVIGLLWAKRCAAHALAAAAKLAGAGAFLWAGSAWGLLESKPGRFAFAGLALSALGDALLIPAGAGRAFLAGMAAFALAHLAYAAACLELGVDRRALAIGGAIGLPVFVATWRWLGPRVQPALRAPVGVYTALVIAMALLACAATARGAPWPLAAGGLAFATSDLSVARERFVAPSFANVAWGLPLYFAAQLALAAGLASR